MSGGIATPPLPQQSPTPPVQPALPQESPLTVLIQDRICKTRRQVKGVDIIAGLLTLIVGALTYLFVAALADHWLVRGGLGFWGRLLLWAILISAAGLYFVKCLWPALVLRINPIFAARTIEQCKPSLKNSLINFLLLRGRQKELAPVIYQALEQRAASDLKDVQIETAVDRRPVLRLSYLLLAVVGVICLYLAISPKSPITSAQRVLWPWSGVRAPTRVNIENVQPGDATAFHGDFVTVSADVMGLNQGETVLLHYSTADGEMLDQVIPMTDENSAYRRQAKLPPDTRGLQQDYSYFITAGDCKTATYHIQTQISPLIVVDKVDYHYPPYTGTADRSVQRQGDVQAIEGTQITIHATANQPIERAEIDFSGAGVPGIRMDARDRAATGRFTLHMLPDDPTRAEHDFYQLRFTDINHRGNRRPIRYNIEVLRDLPPVVQIVDPQKDETSLPLDGKLEIRIRAEDPDFGLCRVALRAELEKQSLKIPPLLDAAPPEKPTGGLFRGKYEFDPKKFNLKPGDRVAYWAEAEDNKEPSPNLTATGKQWIVVVPPDNPQTKNDQQPHRAQRPGEKSSNDASQTQKTNQQPNEKSQPGQQQGDQKQPQNLDQTKPSEKDKEQTKPSEKNEKGEKGDGNEKGENRDQSKQDTQGNSQQQATDQSQSANQGESSQTGKTGDKSASPESGQDQRQSSGDQTGKAQEPIDPNTNPGDAIQAILKHRQEEQQKEQQKTQPGEQQQNNQKQPGEKQQSEGKQGEMQSSGEKKQSEGKQGEMQSSGEKKQSEGKQGEKQPDMGQKSGVLDQTTDQQQKPGADQISGTPKPSPEAQDANQPKTNQSGQPAQDQNKKQEQGQSPSTSPKQSDAKSESAGDRSGQGEKGGGQQAKKPGGGSEGSQTPAEQGSSVSSEKGQGETTGKPGDQSQSRETTGSAAKQQAPQGSHGKNQPDGKPSGGEDSASQQPQSPDSSTGKGQQKPPDSNELGSKQPQSPDSSTGEGQQKQPDAEGLGSKQPQSPDASTGKGQQKPAEGTPAGDQLGKGPSAHGSGNPTVGGQQGPSPDAAAESESRQSAADAVNLDYARKQTILALEHLEDQLAKDQPELLERLGWTREQAQRFIDRWRQLSEAAEEKGSRGEAAKKQLDDALKSLGLRPGATVIKHGGTKTDQIRDLRDSGRFAPPQEWAEQFREYTRGVANQGSSDSGQGPGNKEQ